MWLSLNTRKMVVRSHRGGLIACTVHTLRFAIFCG
jgi:hypothetical protein